MKKLNPEQLTELENLCEKNTFFVEHFSKFIPIYKEVFNASLFPRFSLQETDALIKASYELKDLNEFDEAIELITKIDGPYTFSHIVRPFVKETVITLVEKKLFKELIHIYNTNSVPSTQGCLEEYINKTIEKATGEELLCFFNVSPEGEIQESIKKAMHKIINRAEPKVIEKIIPILYPSNN